MKPRKRRQTSPAKRGARKKRAEARVEWRVRARILRLEGWAEYVVPPRFGQSESRVWAPPFGFNDRLRLPDVLEVAVLSGLLDGFTRAITTKDTFLLDEAWALREAAVKAKKTGGSEG